MSFVCPAFSEENVHIHPVGEPGNRSLIVGGAGWGVQAWPEVLTMAGEKSTLAFKALPAGTLFASPNSRIDFPDGPWALLAESALLLERSSNRSWCVQ